MKMTDIPALPKINKPLNRRVYDLAWLPFGVLAQLLSALMSQAKSGFFLAGIIVLVGAALTASSTALDGSRVMVLSVVFVALGLAITAGLSLLSGVIRLMR